jgi:hypothetical protein
MRRTPYRYLVNFDRPRFLEGFFARVVPVCKMCTIDDSEFEYEQDRANSVVLTNVFDYA